MRYMRCRPRGPSPYLATVLETEQTLFSTLLQAGVVANSAARPAPDEYRRRRHISLMFATDHTECSGIDDSDFSR
jgi:hypothetical protein